MATWLDFIRTLLSLFGIRGGARGDYPPNPTELQSASGPLHNTQDGYDAPEAHVKIYSSAELDSKHGRWPEKKSALALSNALDEAKINYDIEWGSPDTFDPPQEGIYADGFEMVHWWRDNRPTDDSDVQLLLVDDRGGVTLGTACLGGASSLNPKAEVQHTATKEENNGLHGILHEVGHALGVEPDANPDEPGKQTLGRYWVENGYWHRTLVVSTNKQSQNACGEEMPPNDEDPLPVMVHNRFSDCATGHIKDHLAGKD